MPFLPPNQQRQSTEGSAVGCSNQGKERSKRQRLANEGKGYERGVGRAREGKGGKEKGKREGEAVWKGRVNKVGEECPVKGQ